MKKIKSLLIAGLALGLVGGSLTAASLLKKEAAPVSADGLETYIPMTTSFFTNWTDDAGKFENSNATFWNEGYSFQALDTFYCGERAEGYTGTLTSRQWDQSEQYIYFQLGGAKDYGDGDHVHLVIHYGSYSDDFYNNTFVENPMTLRYFKIPQERYDALKVLGDTFKMSIDIVDPRTNDYGLANFGYLHVNQTLESTSNAMRYFINNLKGGFSEWEINKRKEILNSYFSNSYQKEVFLSTVSNADESFESNADFLNHWYFDYNYFNNDQTARHFDEIISTASARTAESSNMPYNKTGNGFFKGWYDDNGRGGFTATDGAIYRFVSRPFVLGGTDLISIKMAGRSASLHVLDGDSNDELAFIDLRTYNPDGGQNNIALGGMNTCTMVRHIINLEQFHNQKIRLAIADVYDSGWAASYFDELVTYYATEPSFRIDRVTQTNETGTFYASYSDRYINSTPKETDANGVDYVDNGISRTDSTDMKAAYDFVQAYLGYARQNSLGTDLCTLLTTTEMNDLLDGYAALSADAKAIVCASDDYQRYNATGDNWYTINPTILSLGQNLQYIASRNSRTNLTFSNVLFGGINNMDGTTTVVVMTVSAMLAVVALTVVIFLKKRKLHI